MFDRRNDDKVTLYMKSNSTSNLLPVRCVLAAGQVWKVRRTRSRCRFAELKPVCFSEKRDAPAPRRWERPRPPRTGRGQTGAWWGAESSAAWLAMSTGCTNTTTSDDAERERSPNKSSGGLLFILVFVALSVLTAGFSPHPLGPLAASSL